MASQNASKPNVGQKNTIAKPKEPEVPPYTQAEKDWLKKTCKDEFHFLQEQGLSIHKQEDRAEGRLIVRAFMEHDNDELEGLDDDDEYEGNQFMKDLESDPSSHVADYHFSDKELDWIEKHYGHSGNFLMTLGLKPWDNDDCKEAKSIARSFMEGRD